VSSTTKREPHGISNTYMNFCRRTKLEFGRCRLHLSHPEVWSPELMLLITQCCSAHGHQSKFHLPPAVIGWRRDEGFDALAPGRPLKGKKGFQLALRALSSQKYTVSDNARVRHSRPSRPLKPNLASGNYWELRNFCMAFLASFLL